MFTDGRRYGEHGKFKTPDAADNSKISQHLSLPVKGMGMMNPGMMGANSNSAASSAQHRPMVGGGSAAAYEAARADHYGKLDKSGSAGPASMGNDTTSPSGGASSFGLSVNPNQHYEMLKLHHMNLLNEIQETTLMMNLYQQQQLQRQQQQQQLQQQQNNTAIGGMGGAGGTGGVSKSPSLCCGATLIDIHLSNIFAILEQHERQYAKHEPHGLDEF